MLADPRSLVSNVLRMTIKSTLILLVIIAVVTEVAFTYQRFVSSKSQRVSTATSPPSRRSLENQNLTPDSHTSLTKSAMTSEDPLHWKIYENGPYQYQFDYPTLGTLRVSDGGLDEHNLHQLQDVRI